VIERVERIAEVRSTTAADATTVRSGLVAVREARAWLDAQHAGLVAQLQSVSSIPVELPARVIAELPPAHPGDEPPPDPDRSGPGNRPTLRRRSSSALHAHVSLADAS
jgi:hypothetical protein